MTTFKTFDLTTDIVTDVENQIITSGMFEGGNGAIFSFFSSSAQVATATYIDIYSSDPSSNTAITPEFSIFYGDYFGSGSAQFAGHSDNTITRSKTNYSMVSNTVLGNTANKLTISESVTSDRFLGISFNRGKYKERVNPGGFELHISDGSNVLKLIDDYQNDPSGFKTNNLDTFKIVSGTGESIENPSDPIEYGRMYPDIGLILLDVPAVVSELTSFEIESGSAEYNNAIKFKDVIQSGSYFRARSEEQIKSTFYFCNIKSTEFNFTNNPTFTTGSTGGGQLRHSEMQNDPQVYVTSIGLYNEFNELVAVAKTSRPILKNFTREMTFRVKLDY